MSAPGGGAQAKAETTAEELLTYSVWRGKAPHPPDAYSVELHAISPDGVRFRGVLVVSTSYTEAMAAIPDGLAFTPPSLEDASTLMGVWL